MSSAKKTGTIQLPAAIIKDIEDEILRSTTRPIDPTAMAIIAACRELGTGASITNRLIRRHTDERIGEKRVRKMLQGRISRQSPWYSVTASSW